MPKLDQRNFIGGFGSLDNGAAEPAASPDALIKAFDIEHDRQGSIRQRPGHLPVARLASWSGEEAPLTVKSTTPGAYTIHFRVTYVTAAGETDDLLSNCATSVQNCANAKIDIPFNLRGLKVVRQDVENKKLFLSSSFLFGGGSTSFDGFEIWSRGPFLQDETRLGVNPQQRPLYNGTRPLATVTAWDATEKSITVDTDIPDLFAPGMTEADRTIDMMFPDRTGLPVLWWNLYASTNGTDFYHYRSGTTAEADILIEATSISAGNTRAPSTRINRLKPTVAATAATRTDPESGRQTATVTGIPGGTYYVWYQWVTGKGEYVDSPGWDDVKSRLGFNGNQRLVRAKQLMWPSDRAFVNVTEGEQITVTLPTFPSGVHAARIFAERVRYFDTAGSVQWDEIKTFDGSDNSRVYEGSAESIAPDWAYRTALTTSSPSAFRSFAIAIVPPQNVFGTEGNGSVARFSRKTWPRLQFEFDVTGAFTTATPNTVAFTAAFRRKPLENLSDPTSEATIHVRLWNDLSSVWTTLGTINVHDLSEDTLTKRTFAGGYDAGMVETVGGVDRMVVSMELVGGVDAEIDYAELNMDHYTSRFNLKERADSSSFGVYAFMQTRDVTSTTYTFNKPLQDRAGYAIQLDTTGQWPLTMHSTDVVGDQSGVEFASTLFVGAADSVFIEDAGQLKRVFRDESASWSRILNHEWRFANYLNRTFFYNEGREGRPLMFDGYSTHLMGLADPDSLRGSALLLTEAEEDSSYGGEYYVQWVRKVQTLGRSYIKLSRAVQFTETFQLSEYDNLTTQYRIIGPGPNDPQVTHARVYRTKKGTGKAFLTREIPLIAGSVGSSFINSDGQFVIDFTDWVDDDLLGREADFNTGPPPSAHLMEQHGDHIWLVPTEDRELVFFSRITQEGSVDPEGFDPADFVDVKTRRASTINALSSYGPSLLIHTDNGVSAVNGVPPNIGVTQLFADSGAIGPKAWANVDNAQWIMTRRGPSIIYGSDLRLQAYKVEESLKKANFDTDAAKLCNTVLYRARGRTQLLFTYPRGEELIPNRVLVNDLNVGPGTGEPREMWAEWKGLVVHDAVATDDYSGNEIILFSDQWGNVMRHDGDVTDAGLPVEIEVETKPIDLTGRGVSFRPRFAIFKTNGVKGHLCLLEVKKDYQKTAIHPRPFHIDMGVFSAAIWGEFAYGDGTVYGDATSDALFNSIRTHLGRSMQQIQFEISTKWEDLPPGTPRGNMVELAGYEIFYRPLSVTSSRVLS